MKYEITTDGNMATFTPKQPQDEDGRRRFGEQCSDYHDGKETPNPGSNEAIDRGCTCPVLDNGRGNTEIGRIRGWWINSDCPLHGG